jgi:hypothetical protein
MLDMQKKHSDYFTDNNKSVCNIKDGNTLAAVINHTGQMLGDISVGKHKIYDMMPQISKEQKEALVKDVTAMVAML